MQYVKLAERWLFSVFNDGMHNETRSIMREALVAAFAHNAALVLIVALKQLPSLPTCPARPWRHHTRAQHLLTRCGRVLVLPASCTNN